MYILLLTLPFIGFLFVGCFGRFLGPSGAGRVCLTALASSFILACIAFYEVCMNKASVYIELGPWIELELFDAYWSFTFDPLACSMLIMITGVSFLIHFYSTDYMSEDPCQTRFLSYLSMFTSFMLMYVASDNFLILFLFLELLSLCSFLLINFWYTRVQANKAAMKGMIVNRVSDFGFALGILSIFYIFRSVNFSTIFCIIPLYLESNSHNLPLDIDLDPTTVLNLICLFLLVGAMGKSAQLGLHTWLPDAMEAPSPVSALIHAATMVTAGVFLIIRTSSIFEYASWVLSTMCILGAMTAFFAATVGLVQNDLKKVIAYSTCSQLGYMLFACGLSSYSVSMFHLLNHAYFKALLFLSAGSIIHALADEQDMRAMGGLRSSLPFTYSIFVIGSLSLMGFPFLTGFYSKDVILEVAYASYSVTGSFAHWLGCISAFFTAFYSFRLLYLTFIRDTNCLRSSLEHIHEAPFRISVTLSCLALASIFIGFLTRDFAIGLGTTYWENSITILSKGITNSIDGEFLPLSVKLLPVIFSISGAGLSLIFYHLSSGFVMRLSLRFRSLYVFLNKKWLFDKIYNEFIANFFLRFGYSTTYKLLDKGLIESFGPLGLSKSFLSLSKSLSQFHSGYIYNSTFSIVVSLFFVLTFSISAYLSFIFVLGILLLIILSDKKRKSLNN